MEYALWGMGKKPILFFFTEFLGIWRKSQKKNARASGPAADPEVQAPMGGR
jgi:hypothetical protein